MATKHETIHCVQMKDRIQERLMAEYEARKDEFASYEEFINAAADRSPWVRKMRRRARGGNPLAGTSRR
jgi:hypothetical protein